MDNRRLTTPRAAAIAGILFGVLFTTSLILLRSAIPTDPNSGIEWIERGASRISVALELMPFAGIAFLWFIGVVRDRLGRYEDQFFSTVFFGSGLLFLAMVFVSVAIAGGMIAWYKLNLGITLDSQVIYFRSFIDDSVQQCLRLAYGWRFHDLPGDDLVADRVDTPLAGHTHLSARRNFTDHH